MVGWPFAFAFGAFTILLWFLGGFAASTSFAVIRNGASAQASGRRNVMTKGSKVRSIEILACDAGWRKYHFVKILTEDGSIGWSEFDEGFGSPGVGAAIQ